jgi:hypothetical protein
MWHRTLLGIDRKSHMGFTVAASSRPKVSRSPFAVVRSGKNSYSFW